MYIEMRYIVQSDAIRVVQKKGLINIEDKNELGSRSHDEDRHPLTDMRQPESSADSDNKKTQTHTGHG